MNHLAQRSRDTAVLYVPMPLIVRAAWVPDEDVVLIDETLDDEERVAALVELFAEAAASAAKPAPRRDLSAARARRARREAG